MTVVGFERFGSACLASAVCLVIGVCTLNASSLMDNLARVGSDVQLPLERIAIDHSDVADVAMLLEASGPRTRVDEDGPLTRQAWKERQERSIQNGVVRNGSIAAN
jgi:hypothetical protein